MNAAVEAILEAGGDDVLVIDGHGPGGIVFEELHPDARLEHGRPLAPWMIRESTYRQFDVSVMIGQHCMAGKREGNLNHTQSSRTVDYYKLNGTPIGEIGQWALYCGALGIPVIFLSGDEEAAKEAEELIPGICTTAVKVSLARNSAISVSKEESRRRIRKGVKEALEKQKSAPVKPLVWKGPFNLEKRFFTTEPADRFTRDPRYARVDDRTVRITSGDILEIIYS